jgi:hypothetical protein
MVSLWLVLLNILLQCRVYVASSHRLPLLAGQQIARSPRRLGWVIPTSRSYERRDARRPSEGLHQLASADVGRAAAVTDIDRCVRTAR